MYIFYEKYNNVQFFFERPTFVKVYGEKRNGNSMEHNKINLHKFKSKSNFSFGTRGNLGFDK
jgi:hypothetical protein